MNVYHCQIFEIIPPAFGKILRHVKDKTKFYGMLAVPSAVVIIVWWVLVFREYGSDISQMYIALLDAYSQPNLWHVTRMESNARSQH